MSEDKKPLKVAIIGTAEPHWRSAPFADDSWQIWTCGGIFNVVPRTDKHIEIHDKAETCRGWAQTPEQEASARAVYWQWLADKGPDAILKRRLPETPEATEYPLQAVLHAFPDGYFTNSVSYMIALAIIEGADEIGLWGIDMALSGSGVSDEYGVQRPSVEFYLGIAMASGIKLHLPPETTLLKCRRLYGFDGPSDDGFNRAAAAKVDELLNRQQEIKKAIAQMQASIAEAERDLRGSQWALEVAGYFQRNMEH